MFQPLARFFGGLLIGFGLGVALSQNLAFSTIRYLSALILSLVLGGFLLAFSWRGKRKKKELTVEPSVLTDPGEKRKEPEEF